MSKTLVYNGPPSYVVALEREVEDGDEFSVSDKATADALLCAHGFREKGAPDASSSAPKLASKQDLIDRAEALGLDVRASDTKESLAVRVLAAGGDTSPKGAS